MFASLTEEAAAIGWYEQRLAVEQDEDARAIIAYARHEEYKHFDMDLEFLFRKRPEWAAIAKGAVVLALRGGDCVFHCGQDVSVGYTARDAEQVMLYLEASFTFRNLTPEVAVSIA